MTDHMSAEERILTEWERDPALAEVRFMFRERDGDYPHPHKHNAETVRLVLRWLDEERAARESLAIALRETDEALRLACRDAMNPDEDCPLPDKYRPCVSARVECGDSCVAALASHYRTLAARSERSEP